MKKIGIILLLLTLLILIGSSTVTAFKCHICDGTGKCTACGGDGIRGGQVCSLCGGSGDCKYCYGTGELDIEDSEDQKNNRDSRNTSGFELIILILSMFIVLYFIRKDKRNL